MSNKKKRADLALANGVKGWSLSFSAKEKKLVHLTDLFLERHLREQRIRALTDLRPVALGSAVLPGVHAKS
jgi:hypothetical protein